MIRQIHVEGLSKFNRDLKRLDAALLKVVKEGATEAAQIVVDDVRPRIPIGPARGGHVVSTIKAASTQRAARISAGGKRFPYYAWLDFGGRVGRKKRTKRAVLKEGRFIYPSLERKRKEVVDALERALNAARRAIGI